MRRVATLLTSMMIGAPSVVDAAERRAVFSDWMAVCQTDGPCFAESFAGTELLTESTLRIEQPVAGVGYRLVFTAIAPRPKPGSQLAFATIGRIIAIIDGSRAPDDHDGTPRSFRFEGEIVDRSMMMFMELEQPMTVGFEPAPRSYATQRYSLRGLTAALGWFELGRARAAERKGRRRRSRRRRCWPDRGVGRSPFC